MADSQIKKDMQLETLSDEIAQMRAELLKSSNNTERLVLSVLQAITALTESLTEAIYGGAPAQTPEGPAGVD